MHKQFYGLFTLSLYDSRYRGYDKIWRSTAFNGKYIINLLGGYEFQWNNRHALSIDIRTMTAGGKRYVPANIPLTMMYKRTILDWNKAYESRFNDYYRLDLRISYRISQKRSSQYFALDMQNLTNHKNILIQRIDPQTGESKSDFQFGFFPMIFWKIEF